MLGVIVPVKKIEYGVYGDLSIPKAIFYLLKSNFMGFKSGPTADVPRALNFTNTLYVVMGCI